MNSTADKIREFLKNHEGFYIAPNHRVEIMLETVQDNYGVSVTLPINVGENRKMNIDLVVRFKSIEEFVTLAGITDIQDLDTIKYSVCWQQYNLGNAYVSCQVHWLNDASICFRRTEAHFTYWEERLPGTEITMIYSMDIHYYDEEQCALSVPEQFIKYIEEKKEVLKKYDKMNVRKGGFEKL